MVSCSKKNGKAEVERKGKAEVVQTNLSRLQGVDRHLVVPSKEQLGSAKFCSQHAPNDFPMVSLCCMLFR